MRRIGSYILLLLVSSIVYSQNTLPEFYDTPYDETSDPFQQLAEAKERARAEHKLILLDVGGEWCIWCHRLDDFFRKNTDVAAFLKEHYVPVKINFSMKNKNARFLRQYPAIEGYPHIFLVDADGVLVHSQDTGELEEGKGHGHDKVMTFPKKWAGGE